MKFDLYKIQEVLHRYPDDDCWYVALGYASGRMLAGWEKEICETNLENPSHIWLEGVSWVAENATYGPGEGPPDPLMDLSEWLE